VLDELLVPLEGNDSLELKDSINQAFQSSSHCEYPVPDVPEVKEINILGLSEVAGSPGEPLKPAELLREQTPESKGGQVVNSTKQKISFFGNKVNRNRKRKAQLDLLNINPRQSVLRPRVLKDMKRQIEGVNWEAAVQNFSHRLVKGSILL